MSIVSRIVLENIQRCEGKEGFMNLEQETFLRRIKKKKPEKLTQEEKNFLHNLADNVENVAPKNPKVVNGLRRAVGLLEEFA